MVPVGLADALCLSRGGKRIRVFALGEAALEVGSDPSCDVAIHAGEVPARALLIQSRAIDETGYIQPTKDELRAVRGENSIYHNNGIQTWHVRDNGEVENVEIS